MGRLSTFDERDIYASVARGLAVDGGVSISQLVRATGVASGSLYHRFGSREGLLASAWLDALASFQAQFLAALQSGKPTAGEDAALATPRFCRKEPDRALILTVCRRAEFLNEATPQDLRRQVDATNAQTRSALRDFATSRGIRHEQCLMAVVGLPLGVVRFYLPDRPVPKKADDYVRAAYRATLTL